MAETMQSLDQLATLKPAAPEAPKYVQKIDKQGRAYATGKRKDAVARVWIKPGPGKIVVNERTVEVYFARPVLRMLIQQPLVASNRNGQYDIICTVSGGGLSGQAGAVRHGLSKALMAYEPDLRGALKRGGPGARSSSPSAETVQSARPKGRSGAPFLCGCFAAYSSPFCRSLSGILTVFRPALSLYSRRIRQKGGRLVKCPAKSV